MSQSPAKLNAFPIFMRVEGRRVVIVGNGDEALAKARLVGQSDARLVVVADGVEDRLRQWIAENGAELIESTFDPAHLDRAVLVFAATGDEALDERISADARRAGIAVNAVDRPELCDFYTPAIVNRAPLVVAVGTEGAAPVLAQLVRARIDGLLPPSLGLLASLAGSFRDAAERLLPRVSRGGRSGTPSFRERRPGRSRLAASAKPAPPPAGFFPSTARAAVTLRWSAPALARKTC